MRFVAAGVAGSIGLIAAIRTVDPWTYAGSNWVTAGGRCAAGTPYRAASCAGVSDAPVCGSRTLKGPSTRSTPLSWTSVAAYRARASAFGGDVGSPLTV